VTEVEVFADVSCPFTYVSLVRLLAHMDGVDRLAPHLRVRAWPLEVVNGSPLSGAELGPKIVSLRRDVAPGLFEGFDPSTFPTTTLPALAAEHVAHATDPVTGLRFSLALRRRLFEEGADLADPAVLDELVDRAGLRRPSAEDRAAVLRDHEAGVARGVQGSPHYFTDTSAFFCPTLAIEHDEEDYTMRFDEEGFDRFVSFAFP
jgi:2-hydroxychromene-2-carboxylate isomerase